MCDSGNSLKEFAYSKHFDEILIRTASPDEQAIVKDVLIASYIEYSALLPENRWAEYKANIEHAVQHSKTSTRLVAEYNGSVVGSVFIYPSAIEAYGNEELNITDPIVRLLGVSPSARGLGIGKKLLTASIEVIRETGAKALYLHTSDMMSQAIKLYEQLGFRRALDKEYDNEGILVKSYQYLL